MKTLNQLFLFIIIATLMSACASDSHAFTSAANGEVITDMTAPATGGGPFDRDVNSITVLDELVASAWGVDLPGLHRGHRPIQGVLEAFFGISHDKMHYYMEQKSLNLAGVCRELGYDADNLVESLANSFTPYIDEAVSKGVITAVDATAWKVQVREQFHRRVYWQG